MPCRQTRTLLLACVFVALGSAASLAQERLLNYSPSTDESALIGLTVSVNTQVLAADPAWLQIDLPDGGSHIAVRDGADLRAVGDLVWRGRFQGRDDSRVVLTLKDDLVVGRFALSDQVSVLEPTADGHRVRRLDFEAMPPEAEPLVPGVEPSLMPPTTASIDPVDGIDVMVVYSPQARAGAGGTSQIEMIAQAAVDNANTAFIDSGMDARFVLVHTGETTGRDEVGGDLDADLEWVTGDAGVASLRDQVDADLVALLVNSSDFCGLGWVMRNPGPGFEDAAFQVTVRDCAVGNLSYAHEHGHNMGFEHDPDNGPSPSTASYPWSFGHNYNGNYRTVMSYNCTSNCSRVAYFSNPGVNHAGLPTGIDDQRDNARSGDLTAPIVTDFRLRNASAPDLIVTDPSVSDTNPATGQSFTTSATAHNQGDAAADATTLRYYQSTNSTISTFDVQMSSDPVGALAVAASSPESDVHAINAAGTWWIGACVDSVPGESNPNNNCSAGVEVEVVEAGCTEADEVFLDSATIDSTVVWQACTAVYAGPDWTIADPGNVTLRAGESVVLRNGVTVQPGGSLTIEIALPE